MALPLLAFAATAFSVGSKLAGGYMSGKASAAQAQAARAEAQMADIRGAQIGEASRSQLATILANIDAIQAARGVSGTSATSEAIRARTRKDALRQEAIAVLAEVNRRGAALNAARGHSTAARWAMPMAFLQAGAEALPQFAAAGGR